MGHRCGRAGAYLVDFEGAAVQQRNFDGRSGPWATRGSTCAPQQARQTAPSWPNPARWSLRRQGDDLRATASTASGRHADSIGAWSARAPSRVSTQGGRSRWVVLILEPRHHGCDELHVARREVPCPIVKASSQRKTGDACACRRTSPSCATPLSVPEHRSCVMEPPPRPAGSGRGTCSGSRRGSTAPLTSVLRRWPRSAPGGGGAGGAGRRASKLL